MIRASLAVLALLAVGCGNPPNFLDGSVKNAHPLTFDGEELRYFPDQKAYELEYTKVLDKNDPSKLPDVIAKVDFSEPPGGVVVDKVINLLDPAIKGSCGRVTAANDPFPATMQKGQVIFHTKATVNSDTKGEFAVTFDNGETLFGQWETKLVSVSF